MSRAVSVCLWIPQGACEFMFGGDPSHNTLVAAPSWISSSRQSADHSDNWFFVDARASNVPVNMNLRLLPPHAVVKCFACFPRQRIVETP